jgi:hypothetical protein
MINPPSLLFLRSWKYQVADSIHRNRLSVIVPDLVLLYSTLLLLLRLDSSELLLAAALVSVGTGLGIQAVVPPGEAGGVVANELLVVKIVVVGAGPDGQEVAQTPGEVVAAVRVDGLEETKDNPDVHGDKVELTGNGEDDKRASNDTDAEESGLDGRSVLSGQTERSRVGVVHLVNGLV